MVRFRKGDVVRINENISLGRFQAPSVRFMLRKHPELWDAHWVVTGELGRDFFEICLKDDHGTGHHFVLNGDNLELVPTQIDPTLISFEHPDDLIMEPGDQEREGLWKTQASGWWGVARWSR